MQMQALKDVLSRFDYINFALLFGSTVDDTQKALSDVDVAIYTPIDP